MALDEWNLRHREPATWPLVEPGGARQFVTHPETVGVLSWDPRRVSR